MNSLPPEPSANDEISATFVRALMRYIRSSTILNGPGYKTRRGPNGTTLEIPAARRAASAPVAVLPWSFSCAESEDPEHPGHTVRTGGWDNCRIQVGLECYYGSCKDPEESNKIKGTHLNPDGKYYVRVNLSEGANPVAEIVIEGGNGQAAVEPGEDDKPLFDYESGIVSIEIGTVTDGKLDEQTAMHMNPTVWKYL